MIKEGTVIILENQARYYLLHEIGKLEGYGDNIYYYAVGVTKSDKLNINDVIFLEHYQRDGKNIAKRVGQGTELYRLLSCLEATKILIDSLPGYADKLVNTIRDIDFLEESSN